MPPWRYTGILTRIMLPGGVFTGDATNGKIYLTYDDGPDPEVTPELLDILAELNAGATFFVVHSKQSWWPEILHSTADKGHSIALHGLQHRSGFYRSNRNILNELLDLTSSIQEAGITALRAFRPPFGHIRPDTVRFLRRNGITTILWTEIPGDFSRMDPERLFACAVRNLRPGSILALHDGTSLRPAPVLDLTRRLLTFCREQGWRPVPLSLQDLDS